MKIFGNVITQNGLPELVRCLDSLNKVCDKIYIVDGGSTDGTYEWLKSMKKVYNLEVYQREFDTHLKQRNFILNKTPKDSWVMALDTDESLTGYTQLKAKGLIESVSERVYAEAFEKKTIVISIPQWCYHLYGDQQHFDQGGFFGRVGYCFYNVGGVKWSGHDFHCKVTRNSEESWYKTLDAGPGFGFLHWAYLVGEDKWQKRLKRLDKWKDDHEKKGEGAGEWSFYTKPKKDRNIQELPPGL